MKNSLSILFYLRRSKVPENEKVDMPTKLTTLRRFKLTTFRQVA